MSKDLVYRLRLRAEIRRQIPSRKSVQTNKPDSIADLLEEAADALKFSSSFDIIRSIAKKGLTLAQTNKDPYVDIFQHLLDELERI